MNALIINALEKKEELFKEIQLNLQNDLRADEYTYKWINVREKNINICVGSGCMACQFKTPGLCIQNDDMDSIYPQLVKADLLIFLTPISFGGYYSEIKKLIDRLLPLKIPVYTIYKGEMHHMNRYEKMPNLLFLGVLNDDMKYAQKVFAKLIKRNSMNFFSKKFDSLVIKNDMVPNDLQVEIKRKLRRVI